MENEFTKKKASGISAVLGNNGLSKTIKEALDSPFGSTKREKASSILRAVNAGTQDGMGGGLEENMMYSPDVSTRTSTTPVLGGAPVAGAPTGAPSSTPTLKLGGESFKSEPGKEDLAGLSESGINIQPNNVKIFPSAPKLKTGVGALPNFSVKPDGQIGPSGADGETLNIPQTQEDVSTFIDSVDEDYIKNWYQGLPEDEQKRWQPLYEAAESGVGAKTFAWNIMQDTQALKQLFPNVPIESLPQGASLVGQLEQVEDNLRDEFEIDKLKNNLDRQMEEGFTIEDNLTDYITARDTYIERLDDMIGTAKDSITTMDMANPYIAKKMNGYLNYLYIMKGRQQKTYTDFLNSGLKQYNQQLLTSENLYNNAYDRFSDALKNKQAITTEQYGFMTDMLQEMYTNIEGREKSMLEMEQLRQNVLQEQYQTASDAIDSLSSGSSIELTTKDRTDSQRNYLKANPTKTIGDWNAISPEEQLGYIESGGVENRVTGMVNEFLIAKFKGGESQFYDEDTGNINWSKIPEGVEEDFYNEYMRKIEEMKASKATKGDTGEEKESILDKIKGWVGGPGVDDLQKVNM